MSIEAMKQALDALEEHGTHYARHEDDYIKAITALREAIEFQEMVAKGTKAWADTPDNWVDDLRGEAEKQEPVSIKKVAKAHGIDMPDHFRDATKKVVPSNYSNSHQPVAWREIMGKWKTHYYDYNEDGRGEPLYAAPREWVGLTDEDRSELLTQHHGWNEFGQAIEAKLKERNNG
jgi:hypothetical protein